jgi:hypothetical protein
MFYHIDHRDHKEGIGKKMTRCAGSVSGTIFKDGRDDYFDLA